MELEKVIEKITERAKTVEEIRCIYSEVSEEGHKWVNLEDVLDILRGDT